MSRVVFVDTETTGLDPDHEQIFEIAVIEENGTEHVFRLEPLGIVVTHMHPKAAEVNRYHERTAADDWEWDDLPQTLETLRGLLEGAHICGAVPDFDARHLAALYRDAGEKPPVWHYHLIDVEALAVGYLWGQGAEAAARDNETRATDRAPFAARDYVDGVVGSLPWRSDDLSRACGVEPPSGDERHTALADARWARGLYMTITGGDV